MKKIITICLASVLLSSTAFGDIFFENDPGKKIAVSLLEDDSLLFEYCVEELCEQITDQTYTASELDKVRKRTYLKTGGKAVVDVAIIAAATTAAIWAGGLGGGLIAEQLLLTSGSATMGGVLWGGLAGGITVGGYTIYNGYGNIKDNYKSAKTIKPSVLSDEDIVIKRGSAEDYLLMLENVLQ